VLHAVHEFVGMSILAQFARALLGPGVGVGLGPGMKVLMLAIFPPQHSSEMPA